MTSKSNAEVLQGRKACESRQRRGILFSKGWFMTGMCAVTLIGR